MENILIDLLKLHVDAMTLDFYPFLLFREMQISHLLKEKDLKKCYLSIGGFDIKRAISANHFQLQISAPAMWLDLIIPSLLVGASTCYSYENSDTNIYSNSTMNILSRRRRLAPPSSTGWTFKLTFDLIIPLEGVDTSFKGSIPVSYKFNITG